MAVLVLATQTILSGTPDRLTHLNCSSSSPGTQLTVDLRHHDSLPRSFKSFPGIKLAVIEQTRYHEEVIGGVLSILHDMELDYDFYREHESNTRRGPQLTQGDAKFWKGWQEVLDPLQQSEGPHVVCLYHEIEGFGRSEDVDMLAPIALHGRLSLLSLGQHSATHLHKKVLKLAAETRDRRWETVSVSHFAPVFRIPDTARPETPVVLPSPAGSILSKAAILGRVQQESLDYSGIFAELLSNIQNNPNLWGYRSITVPSTLSSPDVDDDQSVNIVPQASRQRFVPLDGRLDSRFTLHLVGKDDRKVRIPEELADDEFPIVVRHPELQYDQFYDLIGAMDIVLPAFSTYHYLDSRSSAAIPAAIMAQTRILASPLLLESYTYVGGPAMCLVPTSLSPIAAIALLRASKDPWEELSLDRNNAISASSSMLRLQSPLLPDYDWEGYQTEVALMNIESWATLLSRVVPY
ncbi:hypothetical protein BCR39DRAFT_590175 [Naematelia encephala]|uniref:Uncharacterized protein n=1 Tax=Naematelia encephala TaxID=71784 RepID=A0A1Y2ATE9_9TREE|nr:hypothetical protein BCR39DRAFT_590175 [Naematelia encephala]